MKLLPARIKVQAGLPWGFLFAALAGALGAGAQDTSSPVRLDYSSFRIITERNIFNPGRSGRGNRPPAREERRAAQVDAFSLVGTMSYEKGPFAFFDGTRSDYRKVLPPGGTIAGYKLTEIAGSRVKLEAETNHFELKVGTQLRREDEGPWELREQAEAFASAGSRSDSGRGEPRGSDPRRGDSRGFDSRRGDSRGPTSRGPSASDADDARSSSPPSSPTPALTSEQQSEILKRLMQQREQETK